MRLGIVTSHPIQYYAPIFRELNRRLDLEVFYARRTTPSDQAKAGFGTEFTWDVDLLSGYQFRFVEDEASEASTIHAARGYSPGIAHYLRNGNFDAVLVFGWYLKVLRQAIFAAKLASIPVMIRGDSQLNMPSGSGRMLFKSMIYPFALRAFDAALYVGQRSKEYFDNYGYPAARMFFSPHCVDAQWFAQRGSPESGATLRRQVGIGNDYSVILFAGKLLPFKRPLDLIDAAARLASNGRKIAILIAGAGELDGAIRHRAAQLGVRVVLLGFRNQTEMPACYAASDVLVLPSNGRETWGLVANEALACGCPVIVSDAVGCAPDLASDGVVGRTFVLGNHQTLADAIAAVLDRPPSPEAIRKRSDTYSIDRASDGVIEGLQFVLAQRALGRQ